MKTKFTKKVLFPVEVAYGDYCFGRSRDGVWRTCSYVNCEPRTPHCELFNKDLKFTKHTEIVKPEYCQELIDFIRKDNEC
jgi:hypothetical protein